MNDVRPRANQLEIGAKQLVPELLDGRAPAVSVVIPCYNLGQFLEEAVDSVLAQTNQDFEILVVDDGSTDKVTTALLEGFQRPKTRVLHQENRGLAATRNRGIRETRGRYVCCLDADDRLTPTFFEKAVVILDAQPAVGFVSGYIQMFGERDNLIRPERCELPDMLVLNRGICSAMFRRDLWSKVGGYCETFSASGVEDWDLWVSMLELGYRAEVLQEVILEYRRRGDQMSEQMYRPGVWERLYGELLARHEASARRYSVEIAIGHAREWAVLRSWIEERESVLRWWQEQAAHLEHAAAERRIALEQRERWNEEMRGNSEWWQDQAATWQRLAEEREQLLAAQQDWIAKLDEAKAWWQQQAEAWQCQAQRTD
jgi:glycosyltransferase involved in cell wall biosynthesis